MWTDSSSGLGQQTEILLGLSSAQPTLAQSRPYNAHEYQTDRAKPSPAAALPPATSATGRVRGAAAPVPPTTVRSTCFRPNRPPLHCSLQITQRKADADGRRGEPRPPAPPEGRLPVSARLLRLSSLPIRLPCLLLFQGNSSPPPQTPRNYPP